MDVLITIGDQDTYHENDDEVDASPSWLSDIPTDEEIVAQFVVSAQRAEGVDAMRDVESGELETLRRVFGVPPSCSSQHRHQAAAPALADFPPLVR